MPIKNTRAIIDALLEGSIDNTEGETMPIFGLQIPKSVQGVSAEVLNPRNSWTDKNLYEETAKKLAGMFVDHFKNFTDTDSGKTLEEVGPKL